MKISKSSSTLLLVGLATFGIGGTMALGLPATLTTIGLLVAFAGVVTFLMDLE